VAYDRVKPTYIMMLSIPEIAEHQPNHATFRIASMYRINQKWHYSKLK
jgi:hypothetical protein